MPATSGNDVLSTTSDGETLNGLDGDDVLSSAFNFTTLIGSDGGDRLDTSLFYLLGEVASADATQIGGGGDDILTASIGLVHAAGSIIQDGGNGDDQITARFFGSEFALGASWTLSTSIAGGQGNDTIDISTDLSRIDALVTNSVLGGTGDDRIRISGITNFYSGGSSFTNLIDAGSGNDLVEIYLSDSSNAAAFFSNTISGGAGDDHIIASGGSYTNNAGVPTVNVISGDQGNDLIEAYFGGSYADGMVDVTSQLSGGTGDDVIIAGTNAAEVYGDLSFTVAEHDLNGGSGNDDLRSLVETGSDSLDITSQLIGDVGDDRLSATVTAGTHMISHANVKNLLEGGVGNDGLKAVISIDNKMEIAADLNLANALYGYTGDDTLEASIAFKVDDYIYGDYQTSFNLGSNMLNGGNGNDALLASIAISSTAPNISYLASSRLSGGAGDDRLTVIGGEGNTLDGGAGNDLLTGGDGQDSFTGGSEADRFIFAATGSPPARPDQITDFNARQGDRIDLTALGITAGDLVITHTSGSSYTASGDLDHDSAPDFLIQVQSAQPLATSAFLF